MEKDEFEKFLIIRLEETKKDLLEEFHEPKDVLFYMYRGMINAYTQCLNSYVFFKMEKNEQSK